MSMTATELIVEFLESLGFSIIVTQDAYDPAANHHQVWTKGDCCVGNLTINRETNEVSFNDGYIKSPQLADPDFFSLLLEWLKKNAIDQNIRQIAWCQERMKHLVQDLEWARALTPGPRRQS